MSRARINLNREWKFARGEVVGAESQAFDDSAWDDIGLPHSFDLPYFRTPEFYVGCGWYRKTIQIPPRDGPAFLEFDGAFQVTDVYVNGARAGTHEGGYTGFQFDITRLIRPGANLLAIRVSNEWNPRLAPRAGEHFFSGGLYRDVHLVLTSQLHLQWYGIAVTTPAVSRDSGIVNVKTDVRNDWPEHRTCTLRTRIVDPDERTVAEMSATRQVSPAATVTFDQTSPPIANPLLWHPDHPHLYRVVSELLDGDALVDADESPLGFRWFEWTADRGFFLNGEHLYLRGANAHQDHAGWGIAITQRACRRDVQLMKDAGFNFIRGAHYPHHPAFAHACDEIGMIFWSENCFWGKGGFGPEGYWNASAYPANADDFAPFEAHCKQTLSEMIRTHRNHPSIVVWSMTNEAFFTYNLEWARKLMVQLVQLSHVLDPARPAAIGGAQRGDVDRIGDVAGYNGDGARLYIDPGVPNMVSEYGAISKPHDAYEPFFHEMQTETLPWRSGQAIWCGFDYGTIAGKQGLKGIVDHFRVPKRSWYWYRNEYRGIAPPAWPGDRPAAKLRLTADKTTIVGTDATDDCQITITVCDADGNWVSHCPPVTLTIESGPGEFPTGRSITFDPATDIGISQGQAGIALRSYHGGETIVRATSPGLGDAFLRIVTDGEPRFVPGKTPLARPRSYVPPPVSEAALKAMRNAVNVALNRPCRASSETEHHPARLANDGDADSSWRAIEGAGDAWWQVDLEGFYELSALRVVFAEAANHRFRIETSLDARSWTVAIDRSQTVRTDRVRNDVFPPGTISRFVRLSFSAAAPDPPIGLGEMEVQGVLSVR